MAVSGEWSRPDRVAEYLAREMPQRDVAESLIVAALPDAMQRVLDLGCGDGRMLDLIARSRSGVELVGLDNSEPMLQRAQERFAGRANVTLEHHDLRMPLPALGGFDVAVSGLALHHLEHPRRTALLREVLGLLRPGGVYLNLDLVASPTATLHDEFRAVIGRPQDDPEDRLADLVQELGWLAAAGFADVDCRFRWRELTLLVGRAAT